MLFEFSSFPKFSGDPAASPEGLGRITWNAYMKPGCPGVTSTSLAVLA
jgi:hypothetical protein